MPAHPQDHIHENLHMRMKLACMDKVRLILQAQLQPHLGVLSGGSEITNALFRNTKEHATGANSSLKVSQESPS